MSRPLAVICLAAGMGKRTKVSLPKVLLPVCGRTLAESALAAAATLLEQIVQSARDYEGNRGPEDSDDETRTVSEEPATIPLQDPTSGVADFFVQPPPTSEWPAALSPVL